MNTLKLNTINLAETCAANKPQGDSGGPGGLVTIKWTGHADAEGLRAIGWTDEDIAYYQANGVNWNRSKRITIIKHVTHICHILSIKLRYGN